METSRKLPVLAASLMNGQGKDGGFSCVQLFKKELTASDVGHRRLIIPKIHAIRYFPQVTLEQDAGVGGIDYVYLEVFDKQMKSWTFRYHYQKSSETFVITRGWSDFVRHKNLKVKDVLTFYQCGYYQKFNEQQDFFMIDTADGRDEKDGGLGEGFGGYAATKKEEDKLFPVDAQQPEVEKNKFRLFGVNISP